MSGQTMAESAEDIVANSKEKPGWLSLEYHPLSCRDSALKALVNRDASGFLTLVDNCYSVEITWLNQGVLLQLGILEDAFFNAMVRTRTNNRGDYALIDSLVERLDRARLRDAGDPLPDSGPWTIYRGVAGHGKARRVRGYSWTKNQDKAAWFANRGVVFGLPDPAVFCTTVQEPEILFYSNGREEEEFCVNLPPGHPVKRVKLAEELER